jgi:hypothetical protein
LTVYNVPYTTNKVRNNETVSQTALLVSTELPVAFCIISGFRRQLDKSCALLGYYAANGG